MLSLWKKMYSYCCVRLDCKIYMIISTNDTTSEIKSINKLKQHYLEKNKISCKWY
jgi:hypothetical protein